MTSRDADPLLAQLADAFRREQVARAAEADWRRTARHAMREQAEVLRQLRARRVHFTRAAVTVARALGLPVSVETRQRLAARLRQRMKRDDVTSGHRISDTGMISDAIPALPSSEQFTSLEGQMAVVRRKIVTEEWVERDDEEAIVDAEEHDEGDEQDEDNDAEDDVDAVDRSRRRRKPKS